MKYILAIDQGTHASRSLVIDSTGRVVSSALLPLQLRRPRVDRAEQDAGEILETVQVTLARALAALTPGQRNGIGACGIATQRSTVLAWHRDGHPASPAISWQDTRGASRLAPIRDRAAAVRRMSGLPLSPHYGATKLRWLAQTLGADADLHMGPLAAFLLHSLTGERTCAVDYSNAQRMQLFDIRSLRWSPELGGLFGVPLAALPGCRPSVHAYGTLASCQVPVTALCGDQNATWFACGEPAPGTALVNLGSGAFVLARKTAAAEQRTLITSIACGGANRSEYFLEGTVNGAGSALQWLQEQTPSVDLQTRLADWLQQIRKPPLFMNTVGGLGSPWWTPGPAPLFQSDGRQAGVAERAVAVVESMLFLLRYNIDIMRQTETIRRLRVSGGLSRLAPLCQKLADLSGLPVERSADPEATARGIAWLAAQRPADWSPAQPPDAFQPRSDTALAGRYRLFIERLAGYLETDQHG
jgi:glycerol kinase